MEEGKSVECLLHLHVEVMTPHEHGEQKTKMDRVFSPSNGCISLISFPRIKSTNLLPSTVPLVNSLYTVQ